MNLAAPRPAAPEPLKLTDGPNEPATASPSLGRIARVRRSPGYEHVAVSTLAIYRAFREPGHDNSSPGALGSVHERRS